MSAVVDFWHDIVQSISSVFGNSEESAGQQAADINHENDSKGEDQLEKLVLIRQHLAEIVEDTVLDDHQQRRCLKLLHHMDPHTNNKSHHFLQLFDCTMERRQRNSKKLAGQYLPFCLKSEIEQLLFSATTSGGEMVSSVAHLLDSEEKFLILCLYLLWTSDCVLEVSNGQSHPMKLQSLMQKQDSRSSAGVSRSTSDLSISKSQHVMSSLSSTSSDSTAVPIFLLPNGNLSSRSFSSLPPRRIQKQTSTAIATTKDDHKDGMTHSGRSFITYRSMMSSRRCVIDIRFLRESDIIPIVASDDTYDQTLIRGSQPMIEALVSRDPQRFDVDNCESGGMCLKQRRFAANVFGNQIVPLNEFDDLTLHCLGSYSLEQAQLIAKRMYVYPRMMKSKCSRKGTASSLSCSHSSDSTTGIGTNSNSSRSLSKDSVPSNEGSSNRSSKDAIRKENLPNSVKRADSLGNRTNSSKQPSLFVPPPKSGDIKRVEGVDCFSLVFVNVNLSHWLSRSGRDGSAKHRLSHVKPPAVTVATTTIVSRRNTFSAGIAIPPTINDSSKALSFTPFELILTCEEDCILQDD